MSNPKIQIVLTSNMLTALKARAGEQKVSAYIRRLIEIDLGLTTALQHGGNRHPAVSPDK